MAAFFSCGGSACPKGGEHSWDGPWVEWTNACAHCYGTGKAHDAEYNPTDETCKRCRGSGDGVSGGSQTCSKCGTSAFSHALLNGP